MNCSRKVTQCLPWVVAVLLQHTVIAQARHVSAVHRQTPFVPARHNTRQNVIETLEISRECRVSLQGDKCCHHQHLSQTPDQSLSVKKFLPECCLV